MIKLLQSRQLLFLLIFYSGSADSSNHSQSLEIDNSNMKIVKFYDVKDSEKLDSDITAFSASLSFLEIQPISNNGINFKLDLQYEGSNDIAIHNPIYFVQYTLKGSDTTQQFIGGKPPILLINRQGTIDEVTDFNFDILQITKNSESLNIREYVNMPSITFHKDDQYSYDLQISKYQNQQTKQFENIPEGTYHLDLNLSIVESDATSSTHQSRTLRLQEIYFSVKKE